MAGASFLLFILFFIVGFVVFLYFVPVNIWIRALFSGVEISLSELVFMRIRKSPVKKIVNLLIMSTKSGLDLSLMELETHSLASGDVDQVIQAMLKAKNDELQITKQEIMVLDLAGEDVVKYVEQKKYESTSGIEDLRKHLSNLVLHQLTEEQLKDVDRYMKNL